MNYLLFEKILERRIWIFSIICSVVLIIAIIALWYIIKNLSKADSLVEKIEFHIANMLCIIAIIGSLILGGNTVYSSAYDINHRAYIVYNGEFIVDEDANSSSATYGIYAPDKNGLHLEASKYSTKNINPGIYSGKIIYGKKSKVAFKVDVK